ncbi:hypothetical protein BKA93DRAFT_784005 [Sparassis latifolia]
MDRLESLTNTLSQITMYDIKSMYNQAKNVVFNVSEMEAKVREATNDDPWGASSTLMQDIAQGTYNFQNFNEVMPAIYARFMEKEAKQWRQIYKALQLLEYLVKNGSERVVDDARSHVATIKMLRNFYYIDDKGKDQGLNVRNRSRELVDLLSDVEKIRTERRKAKANKHKYIGSGNDAMSFSSGGSRYGGFGSDSVGYGGGGSYGGDGDYSTRDYGDSYSGSGSGNGGFRDNNTRRFQEYDAGDDEIPPRRSNSLSRSSTASAASPRRASTLPTPTATSPAVPKVSAPAQNIDLLGMDEDAFGAPASNPGMATNKALPTVTHAAGEGDDEFNDFQTAPPSASVSNSNNLSFVASSGPSQAPKPFTPAIQQHARTLSMGSPIQPSMNVMTSMSAMQPMNTMQRMTSPIQPVNMFGNSGYNTSSAPASAARPPYMSPTAAPLQNPMSPAQRAMTPTQAVRASATSPSIGGMTKPAASANFDDLWTMSLGSKPTSSNPAASTTAPKSIKDLEKEKAQTGIWGAGQSRPPMGAGAPAPTAASSSQGGGLDDLLF